MHKLLSFIALLAVAGCGEADVYPPLRPDNVPVDAIWGGGADGGSWLLCEYETKHRYQCVIYFDDGDIRARGTYILRSFTWKEGAQKADYFKVESVTLFEFSFFDGRTIHLKNQKSLLPDGIIDHTFSETSGKKQEYKMGEPVGRVVQYGS